MDRKWRRQAIAVLTLMLIGAGQALAGEPFRPDDDTLVLDAALSATERSAAASRPLDLDTATAMARGAIDRGRATADPRAYGEAQAMLAPWWTLGDPPQEVRLLRGIIAQADHDFAAALKDFDAILVASPRHPQARLSRAFVRMATGDAAAAAGDCAALPPEVPRLARSACLARVAGLTGQAERGMELISAALPRANAGDPSLRRFAVAVLAELQAATGQAASAEALYRLAVASEETDMALIAGYADLLLDQGRNAEAMALLDGQGTQDAVLLRRAIAARRLGDARLATLADTLDERFAAAAALGNRVHLREEARFRLDVMDDAQGALSLAIDSFAVQKEPADARLLLEAAIAAGQPDAAADAIAHIRRTGLADARLSELLKRLEAKS